MTCRYACKESRVAQISLTQVVFRTLLRIISSDFLHSLILRLTLVWEGVRRLAQHIKQEGLNCS